MSHVTELAVLGRKAALGLLLLTEQEKNDILVCMANALNDNCEKIIAANKIDTDAARAAGMTEALVDRLSLDEKRIAQMAQGIMDITSLKDPIGEVLSEDTRPNGICLKKVRVPFGVVGIIYESRPNVTADAVALCLKTSNAVILKGGKEAINSNIAIVEVLTQAGEKAGMPKNSVALIKDTSRQAAKELMEAKGYVDLLVPRGGAGLIASVVDNAKVPVIQTGVGNCHIFIDKTADIQMGIDILMNAKTSRPGVCNAAETLLCHEDIAAEFLPKAFKALKEKGVEIRGCEIAQKYGAADAFEDDYAREFLDLIIAVKVVKDVDEAIEHINKYGTMHSEAIITNDMKNADKFRQLVDASCVYVNVSTRFTDGFEFGFGAEIGISTQKLHARGPMGLCELTSYKYLIDGKGQIR